MKKQIMRPVMEEYTTSINNTQTTTQSERKTNIPPTNQEGKNNPRGSHYDQNV